VTENQWPPLPLEEWRETRDTLHMYTQVIGKLRLALSPFEPQWGNVALYLSARGLTTSPVPVGLRTIDAEFDLIDHDLVLRTSDGGVERRALGGPVAEFHRDVMAALARLQVDVAISVVPSEVAHPIPFPEDRVHSTYDAAHAARFFRVLSMVDVIFKQHRTGFSGRTTPVQFFWGGFDLALTRFSGRPAPQPAHVSIIERLSGGAEEICAGWWPGDERIPYPAFYAYASPHPEGLEKATIAPTGAAWSADSRLFILPYDAARSDPDPSQAVFDFLTSTYTAAAALQGWDSQLTHVMTPKDASPVMASLLEGDA
jgi:hypothetical protein